MIIGVDKNQLTGSHAMSNAPKHIQMQRLGAELVPLRLPFGDYIIITDEIRSTAEAAGGYEQLHKKDLLPLIHRSVDTKKNLVELCQNVCQQHERFKREMLKPLSESDAQLVILIEEDGINSLEDVYFWDNPRLEHNPRAVKGSSLYKSLLTIKNEYSVGIQFCRKADTGKKIIEILGG